jgi:hypothetical protein
MLPPKKELWAVLPEKVLLVTVSVPRLRMPPPASWVKPRAIIRLLSFSVDPDATCITCTALPPSIVIPGERGPLIVSRLSVTCGKD